MTTHEQKLRAFGERIVRNLNICGVDADFNDGALTLADKILDITTFEYIINTSDENILDNYLEIHSRINLTDYFIHNQYLKEVKLDLPSATYCDTMLCDCTSLTSVVLDLPSAINCSGIVYNCTSLTSVKLDMPSLTTYSIILDNSPNLQTIEVTIPNNLVTDFKNYVLGLNLQHLTSLIINGSQYCFNDIELSSDADIIQIEESATITAQLMHDDTPCVRDGVSVSFEVRKSSDDSLVETLSGTTDSTGCATVSYVSKGAGEIYINASCMNLNKRYETIEDLNYADIGNIDKTSNYTITDAQYSYDNNNHYYNLKNTVNRIFGSVSLNNSVFSDNIKILVDVQLLSSSTNIQPAIQFGNLIARMIYETTVKRISLCNLSSDDISYTNYSNLSLDRWYTLELIITDGIATLNLKDNNTVLVTCTGNVSSLISQSNNFKLLIGHYINSNVLVKNLKILEL